MSMYEIEGLVEESIQIIDKSNNEHLDKRNLILNLYNIQENFDCGYTHFRLINILMNNSFTYRINITEHPDYKKYKKYFIEMEQKKETAYILKKPTEK